MIIEFHKHQSQRKFYNTFRPHIIENCYKDDAKNETSRHQVREDFNSNLENVKAVFNNRFGENYNTNLRKFVYYNNFKNNGRVIVDNWLRRIIHREYIIAKKKLN